MEGPCSHPASALIVDREQGVTHCTLCGDVVSNQVYEMDPHFARGAGGGGGGGTRGMPGAYRPTRSTAGGPMPHARPSMELARLNMVNIARTLQMTDDHVEMALGIYKLAVNMNIVSGTRDVVLCACLYAVCRREKTPHVIYDFASAQHISATSILAHMRQICEATHTEVPVADPSCLVQRFAEYLNLGSATERVLICALKLLRAMQDDWIGCGRRPMGVCAAALIAACCLLGIPRTVEQICGVVRLTAGTIVRRLTEFSSTPTAKLVSIDAYTPTNETLPPAYTEASRISVEEDLDASRRLMASLYFQLVGEAKVSAPATPERCKRWRYFLSEHCKLNNISVTEDDLDLTLLSPQRQLTILGLPRTKPISAALVEESVKKEEERLLKREESSSLHNSSEREIKLNISGGHSQAPYSSLGDGEMGYPYSAELLPLYSSELPNLEDPTQMSQLVSQYEAAKQLDEIVGLRQDFDLADSDVLRAPEPRISDELDFNASPSASATILSQSSSYYLSGGGISLPPPALSGGASASQKPRTDSSLTDTDADFLSSADFFGGNERVAEKEETPGSSSCFDEYDSRNALLDMLWDKERRHALPWEFVLLPNPEEEDTAEYLSYIILENEERIRRQKLGETLFGKERWDRGKAKTEEELQCLSRADRPGKKRARHIIDRPTGVSALERMLRGRGAGSIYTSNIAEMIPELAKLDNDDEVQLDEFFD